MSGFLGRLFVLVQDTNWPGSRRWHVVVEAISQQHEEIQLSVERIIDRCCGNFGQGNWATRSLSEVSTKSAPADAGRLAEQRIPDGDRP